MPEEPTQTIEQPQESLSSSSDIFKLPLDNSAPADAAVTQDPPPAKPESSTPPKQESGDDWSETPPDSLKKTESAKPEAVEKQDATAEKQSLFKPVYETEKKDEVPFKSKDAEQILAEPTPKELKGKSAEHFSNAKTKWAGVVEQKDKQLHTLQTKHEKDLALLQQENKKLEERVSHLSGYESVLDYQASEKFKKEYEEPIQKTETDLINYMKARGASKEGLEELQSQIASEDYLFSAVAALEKTNPTVATRFRAYVEKILDNRQKRDEAINEVKSNHTKFIDERRTESVKKETEFNEGIRNSISAHIQATGEDKAPLYPFLVRMKVPEGADAATTERVNQHNNQVAENLRDLETAVKSNDPALRTRLAVGYAASVIQTKIIQYLEAKLKEKDDLLGRVKASTSVPEKAGGHVPANTGESYEGSLSDLTRKMFPPGRS